MASVSRDGAKEPTTAEFEAYLATAEQLLRQSDRRRERNALARMAVAAAALLLLPVVVAIALAAQLGPFVLVVVAVWLGASLGAFRVISTMGSAAAREPLSRDAEAMVQIAALLSDVLPILAQNESWTHIQIRVMEGRLARFPLGVDER